MSVLSDLKKRVVIPKRSMEYIGSMVLGLNDGLIEMTGALAGLTFAFRNTHIIAFAGLITGIAASISMAASEYLSTKEEIGHERDPLRSAIYTGITYITAVLIVLSPYFIAADPLTALFSTLFLVILIIAAFNLFLSIAKKEPFTRKFTEMALITLGAALVNYIIGSIVRNYLKVDL